MATKQTFTQPAIVCGATVRVNDQGFYSLNDMHDAAKTNGYANDNHAPAQFLRHEGVQDFIDAVERKNLTVQKGTIKKAVESKAGRYGGTWAHELVALRYAAWINPAFEVQVYDTFRDVAKAKSDWLQHRATTRLEFAPMAEALRLSREDQGKSTAAHHYSNEADMLNRIVLGKTSKQYRDAHGLDDHENLRDHLTNAEIAALEALQRHNTAFLECGDSYEDRKAKLIGIFNRRHAAKVGHEALLALG